MGIEVFVADEQTDQPVDTLRWVRLAEAVLSEEGVRGDAELSMLFVDEVAMAELNKRFLDRDGPTDVLAFPMDDEPVEGGRSPDSGGTGPGDASDPGDLPTVVGDVVICPAVAYRNAPEHAGTYEDELALLVVHGLLHLLGMDHMDDDEAEAMERRERELLEKFHRPGPAGTGHGGTADAGPAQPAGSAGPARPVTDISPSGTDPASGEAPAGP